MIVVATHLEKIGYDSRMKNCYNWEAKRDPLEMEKSSPIQACNGSKHSVLF